MNLRTIKIVHSSADEWTVDGQLIEIPDGQPARAFVLARAGAMYPPGTPATVSTVERGAQRITVVTLSPDMADAAPEDSVPAVVSVPTVTVPTAPQVLSSDEPIDQPASRRVPQRALRWGLTTFLVLATLVLAVVVVLPRLGGGQDPAADQAPDRWSQKWSAAPASGSITETAEQVAGADVVLTLDEGVAEVYRQDDGQYVGSASAPEGSRIGVGPDFAVLSSSIGGNSSGAVITPDGIVPFDQQPGVLIRRGTVPFLAGGAGAEQYALLYRDDQWKRLDTPASGLAPLAVTENSVVWLGTGRTITVTDYAGSVTSESVLRTPTGAVEATQRAFVTETLIGVVWTDGNGDRELITHSLSTGEILGRSPVGVEVFDKIGEEIASTRGEGSSITATSPNYWQLLDDVPHRLTAQCADPVPSGTTTWCATGDTFIDSNGASLPAGTRPIPSNTDTVPVVDGDRLALYSR